MKKKRRSGLWEALSVLLASLLVIVWVGSEIAVSQSAAINNALNVEGAQVSRSDDEAYQYFTRDYSDAEALEAAYLALCEEAESEGIVLLRNENNALPLQGEESVSLFLMGSVKFNYSASGSSAADTSGYASLKDALEKKGLKVNSALWDFYSGQSDYGRTTKGKNYLVNEVPYGQIPAEVSATFSDFGTAIVTIARDSGEGKDINANKSDTVDGSYLTISDQEKEVLENLTALKKDGVIRKIIVLLNSSATLQMDFLQMEGIDVDACLWVGNVGKSGIHAVASVLTGAVNPSGRLSDTLLFDNCSSPAMAYQSLNGKAKNFQQYYTDWEEEALNETQTYYGVYAEGIYVGYRYYETRYTDYVEGRKGAEDYSYATDVAFPFGYGLSYTAFSYSDFSTNLSEDGETIEVTVKVTNEGTAQSGKESVLVWLQKPYTAYDEEKGVEKSAVELVGFAKTKVLSPGESETVTIPVERSRFKSYDANGYKTYIVEAGEYLIGVAKDAHEAANSFLAYKGTTASSSGGKMDEEGRKDLVTALSESSLDLRYGVSAETGKLDFADINRYEGLEDVTLTSVSRRDWKGTWPSALVELTIDTDVMRTDLSSLKAIPDDGLAMPVYGAEGEMTIAKLRGKAYDDEAWDALLDQMSFAEQAYLVTNAQFTTVAVESVAKPETKEDDGPIGVVSSTRSLSMPCEGIWASTYNTELITRIGDILAEDALEAGKSGLYAGGVNIHRTPFGGRSAEYFSEDPFLSGICSQAEIMGMQAKGVIAHVKHLAFNDEESQRNGICIWLNEQEAREIMLLPFEYSMSKSRGNAHAVMTGFNRVGTDWAGANRNLLVNIIRDEWNFEGYCITDMASSNGAIYMTYQDGIPRGTDCYLGSGSATALDEFKDNASFAAHVREASHRILYNVANYSAVMNGLSDGSSVQTSTPWWMTTLETVKTVLAVLTGLAVLMYALSFRKSKQ